MSRIAVITALVVCATPVAAEAGGPVTKKCAGEKWVDLATSRYGDAKFGPILAIFNRQAGTEACTPGRFIRFMVALKHKVRRGQTVRTLARRFLRGKGGIKVVWDYNKLKKRPKVGTILIIPAEIKLKLGDDPKAQLALLDGIIDRKALKKYNRIKRFKKGKRIFVPIFPPDPPAAQATSAATKKAPAASAETASQPAKSATAMTSPDAGKMDSGKAEDDDDDVEMDQPADEDEASMSAKTMPSKTMPRPDEAVSPEANIEVVKLKEIRNVTVPAVFPTFPHELHAGAMLDDYRCEYCHIADPRRPNEYVPVPTRLCGQCHAKVDPSREGLRVASLPLNFSHDLHLNPERKVQKEYPGKVACKACHPPAPAKDGTHTSIGHPECVKCHNKAENELTMEQCAGCHGVTDVADRLLVARGLLAEHLRGSVRGNNIKFAHPEHLTHLASTGAEGDAACDRCHASARVADSIEDIEPQRMADCLSCHTGLQKIAEDTKQNLNECKTCHVGTSPSVRPTFEAVIDKPLSHTQAFRRRHSRQAKDDNGVCQSCHAQLGGKNGAECNRCHSTMRPSDHFVRWREEPHGRAAIRNPDRCATCHQQDRCADCHAVAPRDHFPLTNFVAGGHGRSARFSMRRCQTCHLPVVDCSPCHNVTQ